MQCELIFYFGFKFESTIGVLSLKPYETDQLQVQLQSNVTRIIDCDSSIMA